MKTALFAVAAAAALTALVPAAHAGIVCKGEFQYVNGSYISTPYCRDKYLARVAREYGSKVSDAAIRDNPNLKSEICRLVGRDNRVRSNCDSEDSGCSHE